MCEKVYYTMREIEKDFFPALYKERLKREAADRPDEFGRKLAGELMEIVRKRLKEGNR